MEKEQLYEILKRFAAGNTSDAERQQFNTWLKTASDEEYNELMVSYYALLSDAGIYESADTLLLKKIEDKIDDYESRQKKGAHKINFSFKRLSIAAAIFLVVAGSLFFYTKSTGPFGNLGANQNLEFADRHIKPGNNRAYLTLANGKRISLTDAANGELAREAGVEISKTANGQIIYKIFNNAHHNEELINTIETPKGGQYQVLLPDGSKVWLNAASKFSYPVSFKNNKERMVTLNGEAYFEVAKDKQHPFIVKSEGQEVAVLGTHFNINSYTDEDATKTTLLEGSVKVNDAMLKPGQQSVLSGKKIKVLPADIESSVAWKNGDFIFKGEDFRTNMRKIARWYDVDIEYEPGLNEHVELGGWVSRSSKLSEVLSRIELAGSVHFKVEGRRVLVTK